MKNRVAAPLLLAVALLMTLGWTGESWGQAKTARVGFLAASLVDAYKDTKYQSYNETFRSALAEHGWIEGKNVSFEYRGASGNPPGYAEGAAELVRLKVDVIFADNAPAIRASYEATRAIPIVGIDFTNDPIAAGYAKSYGRPGGNLTGVFLDAPEFAGKWLELLKAMIPGLSRIAVLWDPSPGPTHLQAVQNIARSFKVQLQILEVHKPDDLDQAFSALRGQPQAVLILPSPMIYPQSARLADLTMKSRLPGISMAAQFAEAGGVLSYGPDLAATRERGAALVAKILDGANPADLPVERPTKFQFVVNLKAAKALGLKVPDSVLVRADKVIR